MSCDSETNVTAASLTDLRRLRAQLDAAAKILDGRLGKEPWACGCGCRSRADHAWRVADQAAGVLKAAAGSEGRTSGHADPVFSMVFPAISGLGTEPHRVRVDPSPGWLDELREAVEAARDVYAKIADLVAVVHRLGFITASEPYKDGTAGTGNCLVCDHLCTGTANDRLRSGFCDKCRKAYKRAGSPDRTEFVRDRRVQLLDENRERTA